VSTSQTIRDCFIHENKKGWLSKPDRMALLQQNLNKTSTRKEIRKIERKRNETKFRSCFYKIRPDEIGIVKKKRSVSAEETVSNRSGDI
jgi:hypothetical protein